MTNTAVIMAAGMGTRFGHYTDMIPKGFIPYKGKPMVIRSIETLIDCGIEKIIIGTGYHKEHAQYQDDRGDSHQNLQDFFREKRALKIKPFHKR